MLNYVIGVMLYKDGDKYDGQWVNDKKGPQGTYYYSDGSIYKGDFVGDAKDGNGNLLLNV